MTTTTLKLNQQTVADPFPMSDVDSQLSALADGIIFATLDMSNGFLQITLSPETKEKNAFVMEDITTKLECMPFGLNGVSGTFRRMMNVIFKDLHKAGLVNTFVDDFIIPSLNWNFKKQNPTRWKGQRDSFVSRPLGAHKREGFQGWLVIFAVLLLIMPGYQHS